MEQWVAQIDELDQKLDSFVTLGTNLLEMRFEHVNQMAFGAGINQFVTKEVQRQIPYDVRFY